MSQPRPRWQVHVVLVIEPEGESESLTLDRFEPHHLVLTGFESVALAQTTLDVIVRACVFVAPMPGGR